MAEGQGSQLPPTGSPVVQLATETEQPADAGATAYTTPSHTNHTAEQLHSRTEPTQTPGGALHMARPHMTPLGSVPATPCLNSYSSRSSSSRGGSSSIQMSAAGLTWVPQFCSTATAAKTIATNAVPDVAKAAASGPVSVAFGAVLPTQTYVMPVRSPLLGPCFPSLPVCSAFCFGLGGASGMICSCGLADYLVGAGGPWVLWLFWGCPVLTLYPGGKGEQPCS